MHLVPRMIATFALIVLIIEPAIAMDAGNVSGNIHPIIQIMLWVGANVTAIFALVRYFELRKKEMYFKDYEIRYAFIKEVKFAEVQSLIDNEDSDLAALLAKVDGSQNDPYTANLNASERILNQKVDDYVKYLEAVAILISKGYIDKEVSGMWSYYLGRIYKWKPLWRYVTYPAYGWIIVAEESKKACERLEAMIDKHNQNTI